MVPDTNFHEAIDTKRKISFCYTDYDINKKRQLTNDGVAYTVSPYTMMWDGDYYYLRGYCDERQAMRTFRKPSFMSTTY